MHVFTLLVLVDILYYYLKCVYYALFLINLAFRFASSSLPSENACVGKLPWTVGAAVVVEEEEEGEVQGGGTFFASSLSSNSQGAGVEES